MRQRKKNEMKETMKSRTRTWYFDGWMFRELDNLEGERRTSYENNKSDTLTHSSMGIKSYVLRAWYCSPVPTVRLYLCGRRDPMVAVPVILLTVA